MDGGFELSGDSGPEPVEIDPCGDSERGEGGWEGERYEGSVSSAQRAVCS